MITHADDDGKLLGDAKSVRARVVPLQNWSISKVESLLKEIVDRGLICRWSQDGNYYIEFPTWKKYQHIRNDRYKPSLFPSFKTKSRHVGIPDDNQETPQYNEIEYNKNPIEMSLGEESGEGGEREGDTKSHFSYKEGERKGHYGKSIRPNDFNPTNAGEAAAQRACLVLEPYNLMAMSTTYLRAYRLGLPPELFDQFVSEIKQEPKIKSKGAVFNKKVNDYFARK